MPVGVPRPPESVAVSVTDVDPTGPPADAWVAMPGEPRPTMLRSPGAPQGEVAAELLVSPLYSAVQ